MKYFSFIFIFTLALYSLNVDKNKSNEPKNINKVKILSTEIQDKVLNIRSKLLDYEKNNKSLESEWTKTFSAYIEKKELEEEKDKLSKKIKKLKSLKSLTKLQKKRLNLYQEKLKIINDKLSLLKNFEKDPFKKLITPPSLSNSPKVTNPISIISALSFKKELEIKKEKYINKYKTLNDTIDALERKKFFLEQIIKLNKSPIDKQHLEYLNKEINKLKEIREIFKTTKNIFFKKAEELKISLDSDIKREIEKVIKIATIAFIFLIFFIFFKYLAKKYLENKDSYYTVNKIINISFITMIILIILFAYLENVSYLITILGFASAGIAIAMKDWFMSLMGWFVIVLGGTIHVGDRVKFLKDGKEYVGDVVDISMLRITIHEDVTLTTYTTNRRAGRIIFVPNNYIFTEMIANYSHSGLKTVWDGIDFYVTFDSNITKATTIAKNIAKQYSKGYTDITRKQLNKLRSKYQLKNTNVEPRVFSFIEGYGMKISVWYLTNAYATLTLRSTISSKILEEILKEDDIEIAYDSHSIYTNEYIPKPKKEET